MDELELELDLCPMCDEAVRARPQLVDPDCVEYLAVCDGCMRTGGEPSHIAEEALRIYHRLWAPLE